MSCEHRIGYMGPCAACVERVGDPPIGAFVGPEAKALHVAGTMSCTCGRNYGYFLAGRSACFVYEPPGKGQVEECVRCGRDLKRVMCGGRVRRAEQLSLGL